MPTRQDARRWSARLTRSIGLRDGTELDTLADAANFILALPKHYEALSGSQFLEARNRTTDAGR
jgi:hypothetical protein